MTVAWPRSLWGRILAVILALVFILILVSLVSWLWLKSTEPKISDPPPGLLRILTEPIPNGPNADLIRRGRYLSIISDCASCHTRGGGRPFEGGLGLKTPFGIIYSANITGDPSAGIGDWTPAEFYGALHDGKDDEEHNLYPAMPYNHFDMIPRADSDAILAYLKTVPGSSYAPPANRLPFPLNIRLAMIGWNALNFRPHGFTPDPSKPAIWNRGAYLVQGPEHCGACHTPKNLLQAEEQDKALQGSAIEDWYAPDLTGNPRTGLGRWSAGDIVEYLKTGRNAHSNSAGLMSEVVAYSTSLMSDSDLAAIATYLKSLPPSQEASSPAPDEAAMRTGSAIFFDECTACHLVGGKAQPGMFPPLPGSAVAQQRDPTGLIHLILGGGRTAPTPSKPTFQSMPSFAWKLSDQQVADVATYVRNSWGNKAPPVTAHQVTSVRSKLKLQKPDDRR
jgi:mono/diheme cytochrome c family protein